ncbi:MAG: hypothetical protein JWP03_1600, partial [Phycisphaerales bacterium]|nr:hypothetical protein [Phycisphaerales bacterium]
MRRDISAAYLSAAARIGAWAAVSALVYRAGGAGEFAVLALVRGTIGILNYTTVGLTPALIRLFAESRSARGNVQRDIVALVPPDAPVRLDYATPGLRSPDDA